jgi:hypothetical protein
MRCAVHDGPRVDNDNGRAGPGLAFQRRGVVSALTKATAEEDRSGWRDE